MLDLALGTFATYNPQSISADTSVDDAIALMNDLGIHHLPVVDSASRVVGIISDRDLLSRSRPIVHGRSENPDRRLVKNVMVKNVFTVDAFTSPKSVLQAILNHGFHCVPVLEEGHLLGMVTSNDFLRELSYGQWPVCNDRVFDHMLTLTNDDLLFSAATEVDALIEETSVVSVDQTLGTAAGLMLEYRIQEIAVVDHVCRTVGILRDDDILRAIVNSLA